MTSQRQPTLSICIATRNRGNLIGETLESIVAQANADTEIVVLDGASTDDTPAIVEQYRLRFPRVRYIRQSANGGVDKDFDRAVDAASGEYCWLMSDDDLLAPTAIETVMRAIKRDFSLIVVNAEVRTRDMSRVLESQRLVFTSDREYGPKAMDSLFVDIIEYMSFIGCVVIRRSIWVERERERYYGSQFIHAGVIFQQPLPGRTLIIAQPLISIRYANAVWKSKEFEIWMFKWPSLVWSLEGVSESARATVCRLEPWRKLTTLLFYRAKGTYSLDEYRNWIKPRMTSRTARLGPLIVALVPGFIANIAALLYCACFSNRSAGMIRVDMMNSPYYVGNWFNARARS